jgi:hypothetical protein
MNYTPTAKPAFQSALSSKDIRDEFSAIATAINSKLDETGGALTATVAELNVLDGITATTAELNILHGVTATTTELNYCSGVTSAIQTQLNGKLPISGGTVYGTLTSASTFAFNGLYKELFDTAVPTATSAGDAGEIRISTTHIYVCTATNTWKRTALSTW